MVFKQTSIEGLIEIYPRIFKDERGLFFELYQREVFAQNGISSEFVQDNQSFSSAGVLRGLHFQNQPFAQGKLVRVVSGKVVDVAVDLRPNSPTFGKYQKFLLDATLQNMVYIPEGFAHGFAALSDSYFFYKCSAAYHPQSETGVIWNDSTLNINWGVDSPIVSQKDLELPTLEEFIRNSVISPKH